MSSGEWTVYMLECGDGSLYTGATNRLEIRVARHQAGKGASYTRSRLPVLLVFSEPASDRSAALRREAALKRLRREDKWALVEAAKATSPRAGPGSRRRRPASGSPGNRRRAGAARR